MAPSSSSSPTTPNFQTARAPRGWSAVYLHSSSPVGDMRNDCESCEHENTSVAAYWSAKRLNVDNWKKKPCWDRRRRDLESAVDPTVPKIMKGPGAPTASERTAHENTHLPPAPWCETCILGRGIEASHVRLTPLERDERPIIAMDFVVRKARADDGRANDGLGTFQAMHASDSARDKKSHRLPCKLGGRLREKPVCLKVQTVMRQRTLDRGGGGESKGKNAWHSGGGEYTDTTQRAKRPGRTSNSI